MKSVTKIYYIYGEEGFCQNETFAPSLNLDFSNENEGIRIITLLNSNVTTQNDYSIIYITRNTEELCKRELYGQVLDGIFENSKVGKIYDVLEKKYIDIYNM